MKRTVIYFCHTIQIQADKIIKKNRVPVNKELLTGTRSLSIRNYWQGQSLSIRNYWQGQSLSIRNYWQGRSLSITSSLKLRIFVRNQSSKYWISAKWWTFSWWQYFWDWQQKIKQDLSRVVPSWVELSCVVVILEIVFEVILKWNLSSV